MKKNFLSVLLIFLIIFGVGCNDIYAKTLYDPSVDTKQKKYPSASDIAGNATTTDAGYVPADAPEINAKAAIVMDVDTGEILYEKAAHQAMYPASITKVLTCLLAVENGNVNDVITVSGSAMNQVESGSSSIGLQAGEQLTLRDALYGMMLNSGNECALAIAEYISGSTEAFADLMNETARGLGCTDSHFVNPNGLHDPDHYTSCYDMALIGQKAYQYPEFKKLISSQSYTIPETNMNEERPLWQENRLIYSGNGEYYYEYSTGGKTGYTLDALATLISYAERDGKRLVTVVMRCDPTTDSYLDTIKLDEFCFSHYRSCKPLMDYEFNSENPKGLYILDNYYNDLDHHNIKYYINRKYSFCIRSYIDDSQIEKKVEMYPQITDDKRGKITFLYNGEVVGETEILVNKPYIEASSTDAIMNRDEEETDKGISYLDWVKTTIIITIILIIILLTIIIVVKIRKRIQYYNSKRNIRYYPISRDARLNKKKEEVEAKKNSKKKNDESSGNDESKEKSESDPKANKKEDNIKDKNIKDEELKEENIKKERKTETNIIEEKNKDNNIEDKKETYSESGSDNEKEDENK